MKIRMEKEIKQISKEEREVEALFIIEKPQIPNWAIGIANKLVNNRLTKAAKAAGKVLFKK